MPRAITVETAYEDLRIANEYAGLYGYGRDSQGNIFVEHYAIDGTSIVGTQPVTITVGEFKPVAA